MNTSLAPHSGVRIPNATSTSELLNESGELCGVHEIQRAFQQWALEASIADNVRPVLASAMQFALETNTMQGISPEESSDMVIALGVLKTLDGHRLCFKPHRFGYGWGSGHYQPITRQGLAQLCQAVLAEMQRYFKPDPLGESIQPGMREMVCQTRYRHSTVQV